MAPKGRRRSQQASVESSDAPNYEENLVERLARSLERSGFTGSTVDQARRLGAVGFDGATDPMVALSWLDDTEKILDEGMQCPDEDRVRIVGFLLGGNARKWWAYERTRKRHTWAQFKASFHTEFCPQPLLRPRGWSSRHSLREVCQFLSTSAGSESYQISEQIWLRMKSARRGGFLTSWLRRWL